ncbi:hypothetical protein [Hyphobacterium sp.]|uniref:hypothetical protein n=1 Tax=Hyphobacterium sp. TaxID=2004662 RepID=UPI003BAB989E
MPYENLLIGISQLGAVFAGFLAIVLVYVSKDGRLSAPRGLRARAIMHSGFLVIFGALLPLVLNALGLESGQVWQWAALIILPIGGLMVGEGVWHHLRMNAEDRRQAGVLRTFVPWTCSGLGMGLIVWLALGLGTAGLYILALIFALASATLSFMVLALEDWL